MRVIAFSRSLMRPPRWRSESAFADAQYLPIHSQARSPGHLAGARSPHSRTHSTYRFARKLAHTAASLALGVRIRGRTVLTDSLASSLIRPPRWRSESAFADAQYLPIRSQARSYGRLAGARSPHSRTHSTYRFARKLAHTAASLALGVRIRGRTVLTDSLASSLIRPPRWRS